MALCTQKHIARIGLPNGRSAAPTLLTHQLTLEPARMHSQKWHACQRKWNVPVVQLLLRCVSLHSAGVAGGCQCLVAVADDCPTMDRRIGGDDFYSFYRYKMPIQHDCYQGCNWFDNLISHFLSWLTFLSERFFEILSSYFWVNINFDTLRLKIKLQSVFCFCIFFTF